MERAELVLAALIVAVALIVTTAAEVYFSPYWSCRRALDGRIGQAPYDIPAYYCLGVR